MVDTDRTDGVDVLDDLQTVQIIVNDGHWSNRKSVMDHPDCDYLDRLCGMALAVQ